MLSSKTDSASIKIVDFGCTEHLPGVDQTTKRFFGEVGGADVFTPEERPVRSSGGTVAYAPPESFDSDSPVDAPLDMWALGIILHIMLTGVHPFDPNGDADDEKLEKRIKIMRKPPLDTPNTEHLSPSAMDLLTRLLEPDPSKRLKASEMLEHSWVRGETAKSDVIADSDQKLSRYRKFRSKIETHVFQELMSWSENKNRLDPSKNGESLVEKAFKSMDKEAKGFLTMDDISKEQEDGKEEESAPMTLSSFSDLLGENMQNKYFPAGHIIFHEGEQGDYMYFLNSGTCEVLTKDGFHHILKHGDTFGEGGLIMEHGKRSATIKTVTPVHAIQIDRECFTKYLLGSNSALALKIKERVNKRKFGRAEYIIGQQEDLVVHSAMKGGKIYSDGDKADSIFFVAEGTIDVRNDGHTVYQANPGELLGVQSFYFNRSRDADAVCRTDHCTVKAINSKQFKELAATMPELKRALHELALRREFQRAIVRKLKTSFSASDLRQVFDQIDLDHSGLLSRDELRDLLTYLDVSISEEELKMLIDTLDLDSTGFINFEEFTTLFA
jgi:CRP-like cAMP-binding protein